MPLLIAVLLCLLTPAVASAAACPGADPCPYSSSGLIGQRAEGVLRFPQATAVGPDGSVYVADQFTHAIQVFGPDGQFRREIGVAGSGPGGLSSVGGVAVGPDGSVYVADGNDRIDRFAADGSLLNSWGSNGSGVGEFRFGAGGGNDSGAGGGLAIGGGFVFVADTRNDRVQRFNLDGTGGAVVVPPGHVKRPQGLAVWGGRLMVADDLGHRLVVFDLGGRFLSTVGSGPGPRPGQLRNPYDVAVDPAGRVFVADNSNHRVVRYGPAPRYVYRGRWGSYGSRQGQLQYPRGLAVDASGRTFVASPGGNRIDMFALGGEPLGSFGQSGRVPGQFIRPHGVGADSSGMRAVADAVNGRIQLLRPDGSVAAMFGAPAPGPTLLPDPVGVAFDDRGLLYVVDQRRSRVLVFNRSGKIIRTIGSRGRGPGELLSPSALAVARNVVYVADTGNGRIVRFSRSGTHLGSIGRFNSIRGVAVTPDGSLVYGSDGATDRITVMTASGGDLAEIGRRELDSPAQIALDAAGNIWVADRGNDRVRAFAPDGSLLVSFGERGVGSGQFVEPIGIAVDCNGLVTVGDADNNRVQQFQFAPTGCGSLPPIVNPPDPILATQPDPLPPEVFVAPTRTRGILGIRQFPVRVRCDLPCRASVAVTLRPRSGRSRPGVTIRAASSLPAGRTVTIRPRLAVAGVRTLARALRGRRGLVAEVRVKATTRHSPPTTVTQRVEVTR
jgi:DNA-binding beta-propeller fold protein YncE